MIPREFIPAIQKGIEDQMQNGVLAGYPLIGLKATVYDGSYHDVDSSEMAFKIAASMATKQLSQKGGAVLLEPVMKVEVVTPEDYMGDVMGDLNRRRGLIQGMEDTPAGKVIRAEVPLGEMFGYATDETPTLMPLPIYLAHRLAFRLTEVRKSGEVPHLRPDGKTQVTIEYDDNDQPVRLDTVLISTQHDPEVTQDWLAVELKKHVIAPVLDEVLGSKVPHDNYRQLVNPTGSFVLGGPAADAGLTGRKIIVDTYGGAAHHGGGAFSGKDPSKVDRSAAYATRWVAKNIVAAGLAHKVEIQIAYAIGVADPVSINVETFGTEQGVTRGQIAAAVRKVFDLRPAAIIDELDLKRPIYLKTAAYGHFGRTDVEFPWEKTDKVEELKAAIAGE